MPKKVDFEFLSFSSVDYFLGKVTSDFAMDPFIKHEYYEQTLGLMDPHAIGELDPYELGSF